MRPGSDAALALAIMHVIITERLYDPAFLGLYL
jgi:anaerobic selenocysteine-containing dehydrogenase